MVVINGYHDQQQQAAYLERLRRYTSRFSNVNLIICEKPTGLSAMWNRAIAASRSERILILNDDLYLMSHFRREFQKSPLLERSIALINSSWSHFVITRRVFQKIGPFDEGFEEIGYEDRDYEVRLACAGVRLYNVPVAGIVNCVEQPKEYSYGKHMAVSDGKYASSNRDFFYRKWMVSDKESPGAVFVPRLAKWVNAATDMIQSPIYPNNQME